MGCDPIPRTSPPPSSGFNPRTRVGCDNQLREAFALQRFVSIHAPAWGATMEIPRYARVFDVSIHAPAWGATLQATLQKKSPRSFNPRTRVGCDGMTVKMDPGRVMFQSTHPRGVRRRQPCAGASHHRVSIHAPAWGATGTGGNTMRVGRPVSIHAPAWGATQGVLPGPRPL